MTLVMVWREASAERFWIVSDSRLSRPGEVGRVRLMDRAAKILEANLVLHSNDAHAPPLGSSTLGFAYTGSSLVALQAYSAVLPLWSRLQSSGQQVLPTVGECATHLGVFVGAYAREIGASGGDGNCQCMLLGPDPEPPRHLRAWLVEAAIGPTGVEQAVRPLALDLPGSMELFGSGRTAAEQRLGKRPHCGWRREPLEMIRTSLREKLADDVGGGVQIGMATPVNGFELCFDAQPFRVGIGRAGDPLVSMHYRGFDFGEISRVGHAFVNLRGVAG